MEIRHAEADDRERIRAIARDSFQSSYSLSPQQIETILEDAFGDEALAGRFEDENAVVLVAEYAVDDEMGVRGFVDATVGDNRTLRWLHVDPQARGDGVGTALIDGVRQGPEFEARILEDAVEGGEFLERFGLEQDGHSQAEFGAEEFAVALFSEGVGGQDATEPVVAVPESVTVDGKDRPVDREEAIPGTQSPFFHTYSDEAHEEEYGYFCSDCGSTAVATDGLDGLECSDCGNVHRPDEWDRAYL